MLSNQTIKIAYKFSFNFSLDIREFSVYTQIVIKRIKNMERLIKLCICMYVCMCIEPLHLLKVLRWAYLNQPHNLNASVCTTIIHLKFSNLRQQYKVSVLYKFCISTPLSNLKMTISMLYSCYRKGDSSQSDPTIRFVCVLKVPTMGHTPYKNIPNFHMHDRVECRLYRARIELYHDGWKL